MKGKKMLVALLASQFVLSAGGCELSLGNSSNGGDSVDTQQSSVVSQENGGEQSAWEEEKDNNIFQIF